MELQLIVLKVAIGVLKLRKGASKFRFVDFNLQKVVLKLRYVVLNLPNA